MESVVELRNMGYWRDDVGKAFEKAAINHVHTFNESLTSVCREIDTMAGYSMGDVQYESQRNNLLQMRVEYHG